MAKQKFSEMFDTSQDRQFTGLIGDVLDKIDERFSDLDNDTQAKFKDAGAEIARMQDDLDCVKADSRKRFYAIAEHYHRGGDYVGPFPDRETAGAFGKFVAAVARGPQAVERLYKEDRWFAAISPESGEKGGFLSPEVLLSGIVNNAEQYGVFERNVRVWPVSGQSASRVTRAQGATVFYPDLGQAPTESTLKTNRVRTELTRYSALAYADRWMMADDLAVSLGDYVAGELGYSLANAIDKNGFIGDGSIGYARVVGIFNLVDELANALVVTADAADDTFDKVIAASVKYPTKCAGELPDVADDENCKWFLHRSVFWTFLGTRDSQNRPVADILTTGERPQRVLCGYPAEVTQVAPKMSDSAASTVMAVLGNLMRGAEMYRHTAGTELRVSEHVKFLEGEVAMLLDVPQGIAHLDENMTVRLKTGAGE